MITPKKVSYNDCLYSLFVHKKKRKKKKKLIHNALHIAFHYVEKLTEKKVLKNSSI